MNKILIINPFGIGDVLFTTPLIANLRSAYPDAFIGYIANRRACPIVESNPKINKVYIYERDEFKKNLSSSWRNLFQQIRAEKFDVVFDFSLNTSFGFFSLVCGIKQRIGYDYRGRGRFLTNKIVLTGYEGRHVFEYYLDLLQFMNIPAINQLPTLELFIDEKHQQWAKDWIKDTGIDPNRPLIAIIPGGGASWGTQAAQKHWPIEQYAILVDKMIAKTKASVILMGDLKDKSLCQELIKNCSFPLYDALGQTSLLQMAALLKMCRLAILNDGGPLHIAVGVGTPTVSIFGPVDPLVYGPYPLSGHVVIQKGLPCQPCYRQFRKASCEHLSCLNHLSAEEVYEKIEGLL